MGQDEEATVQALLEFRGLMASRIASHRGRVVDAPGDNLLAEFPSAVDAVNCAIDIQQDLKDANAKRPPNQQMLFRVGINIGDVLSDKGRIYGDGVNITARIEGLAEPGGICISRGVYDQVHRKIDLAYAYLGEKKVKNISEPVRIYSVASPQAAIAPPARPRSMNRRIKRRYGLLAGVVIAVAAAAGLWRGDNFSMVTRVKSLLHLKSAPPPVIGKPAIVVLPFINLGPASGEDYFSEGITNDLITALSKFSELAVIASNTVFNYPRKGKSAADIGRELQVNYILEGSVQKRTADVRLNAKLVDARNGRHVWAERYDRQLKDVFRVQDELVHSIVGKMAIQIREAETTRVRHKPPRDFNAYEYLLKGKYNYRQRTRRTNYEARQLFTKAVERDPTYTTAYVALGWTYMREMYDGWSEFPNRSIQQALALAQKALTLDETLADAHILLAECFLNRRKYDLAAVELNRALALNPNSTDGLKAYGSLSLYNGDTRRSIQMHNIALRLDPNLQITSHSIHMELGLAYYLLGQYAQAVKIMNQGYTRRPDFVGNHIGLAATYAQMGEMAQARIHAAQIKRRLPFFDLNDYGSKFMNPDDRDMIVAGLRKAGL
jgi:adenylate cyclase